MTISETPPDLSAQVIHLTEQLNAEVNYRELIEEGLADIELAREDVGWSRLTVEAQQQFTRQGLRSSAELCRVFAVANPLVKRALALRTAYVWGAGVQVAARSTGPTDDNPQAQDVNAAIQAFLDDPETKRVLTGAQAHERNERTLGTDGNLFTALVTNRVTGWVRPRLIPFDEIERVVCNPEDRLERRFFLRQHTAGVVESGYNGTPRMRRETRRELYPSIDYRPSVRPPTVDGIPVVWDTPIAELNVNGLDTWDFGIGDAFASLPWARGYKEFLEDWGRLMKGLSRYAYRLTADKSSKARSAASKIRSLSPMDGRTQEAGGTAAYGPGVHLEAVPKTGATLDSGSGRPLAAMVAAGMDVPVTMLLADPGITGARATAETLDKPTELMATIRRDVWGDYLRRILGYVIDMSAKAPSGALRRRSLTRDRNTGREVVELAGDTDRTIEVTWPDLSETPLNVLMEAIVAADGTGKLPPVEAMKLVLHALRVPDVDELVEQYTDEEGNWIDPEASAGQAAVDRFRRGEPAGL